jgi:hypothetical protein
LHGAGITAFGEEFGSLTADAALSGRDLALSRLTIEKPQPDAPGKISATGSYHLDRKSYTFELRSDNVRLLDLQLPEGQRLRGTLQLSASGAGSVSSPAGMVNLTFDSLEIDGLEPRSSGPNASTFPPAQLGRIVLAVTAADHQATITASAEHFNLDAKASVGVARPWPATLTLHANDLNFERLPFGLTTPLDGRLRATVQATGDLAEQFHDLHSMTKVEEGHAIRALWVHHAVDHEVAQRRERRGDAAARDLRVQLVAFDDHHEAALHLGDVVRHRLERIDRGHRADTLGLASRVSECLRFGARRLADQLLE